jgi:hypothetical protein
MRRIFACVAAAGISTNGMAAEWEGTWSADPAWCEGLGEGSPVRITTEEMQGVGNVCEITNVSPTGVEGSWRFDLNCSGEGTPYRASELVMLTLGGELVRYTEQGVLVEMVRCE